MDFKQELEKRGAREFQIVALSMDEERGLAAIAEAERRGVEHVVSYAITLFDDPSWSVTGAKPRLARITNTFADVKCAACGGDRFVPVTDDWRVLYGETYAPCAQCNADTNTTFWRTDGSKFMSVAR